jgi:16S rRNA (adenine1518-N6/adenine1519-N6)-dimethyltransferase
LTRALLLAGAHHVTAIERDRRAIDALAEIAVAFPGRLTILEGDALDTPIADLVPAPRKVVANLPYNIATALLLRWLPDIASFENLTLLFQKEVAERLVAAPRTKEYGRLSVMVQWRCTVRLLFDIAPRAFVPPPKVTSTLVQLTPRAAPLAACDALALERVTSAAFGQRRKMLRQSLKPIWPAPEPHLRALGIAPTARAEELSVEEFCALARESGA